MNKIEHTGPKKGRGGFYGRKKDAKDASSRRRRAEDKRATKVNDRSSQNQACMLRTKGKLLDALMAEKRKEREL